MLNKECLLWSFLFQRASLMLLYSAERFQGWSDLAAALLKDDKLAPVEKAAGAHCWPLNHANPGIGSMACENFTSVQKYAFISNHHHRS
ncbi:MAG: hypothetical protein ACP5NC_05905 [Nitrososphaeria archaeon]